MIKDLTEVRDSCPYLREQSSWQEGIARAKALRREHAAGWRAGVSGGMGRPVDDEVKVSAFFKGAEARARVFKRRRPFPHREFGIRFQAKFFSLKYLL